MAAGPARVNSTGPILSAPTRPASVLTSGRACSRSGTSRPTINQSRRCDSFGAASSAAGAAGACGAGSVALFIENSYNVAARRCAASAL